MTDLVRTLAARLPNRARIAMLIYPVVNAVLFGAGAITVLSVPGLRAEAPLLLPFVVAASFIGAAPVAWLIVPRMRSTRWRRQQALASAGRAA